MTTTDPAPDPIGASTERSAAFLVSATIASLAGALAFVAALIGGGGDGGWMNLLLFPPIALFLVSLATCGKLAVDLARRRPAQLVLPGGRVLPPRIALPAAIGLLAVMSLAREGWLPLSWDLVLAQSRLAHESRSEQTAEGAGSVALGTLPVTLTIERWTGTIGRTIERLIRPASTEAPHRLEVTILVDAPDAWAWMPLYKNGSVDYEVIGELRWTVPGAEGHARIVVSGRVTYRSVGLSSCRAVNEAIGRTIGAEVASKLNAFIAQPH